MDLRLANFKHETVEDNADIPDEVGPHHLRRRSQLPGMNPDLALRLGHMPTLPGFGLANLQPQQALSPNLARRMSQMPPLNPQAARRMSQLTGLDADAALRMSRRLSMWRQGDRVKPADGSNQVVKEDDETKF